MYFVLNIYVNDKQCWNYNHVNQHKDHTLPNAQPCIETLPCGQPRLRFQHYLSYLKVPLVDVSLTDIFNIIRDLDEACMHAVAALLQGLPLQSEEPDRGDLMEAKSQLFLKYFTLFMNLLNDCGEAGGTVITGHEGKEEGVQLQHHGARPRHTNSSNNSLRNATIQVCICMSTFKTFFV